MTANAWITWVLTAAVLPIASALADEPPPLPPGLEAPASRPAEAAPLLPPGLEGGAPPLPPGLDGGEQQPPSLPPGLEDDGMEGRPQERADRRAAAWLKLPEGLTGFIEGRAGVRFLDDPHQRRMSLGETRLQLEYERTNKGVTGKLVADFLYDPVYDRHGIDIEAGRGAVDLREANVAFSPARFMDVKLGRQILTWGTGDLLFINDLFPKDWNAFFIGRDTEYLKAPSDAIKVSLFSDAANLDIVYTPRFDPDRYIDGTRVSFYNTALGRMSGRDAPVMARIPDRPFADDEIAWRLYRTVGGTELAFYGYRGYWKSPAGVEPATGRATFPELNVYGASARGNVGPGIGNIEFGWYDSADDRPGGDPFVRNGELRLLLGYEQDLGNNLTVGAQYYLEHMMDHAAYRASLPPGVPRADEDRHVFTARLTKLLSAQNLELSLFAYYSFSDNDAYLRPRIKYKIDDHWTVEVGGNLFVGGGHTTFFGQFHEAGNLYAALRYGF
jgi:hypothetical protein